MGHRDFHLLFGRGAQRGVTVVGLQQATALLPPSPFLRREPCSKSFQMSSLAPVSGAAELQPPARAWNVASSCLAETACDPAPRLSKLPPFPDCACAGRGRGQSTTWPLTGNAELGPSSPSSVGVGCSRDRYPRKEVPTTTKGLNAHPDRLAPLPVCDQGIECMGSDGSKGRLESP